MKLVHVVPHVDQEASGPSYSVPRLCESLAARGHEVELSCMGARDEIPGVRLDLHPEWPILKRFEISTSHARALRHKAATVDIVHNHSLWSMVNVACGWVVPGRKAKLVTSPRGTLSPWALSRQRQIKKVLWPLQRRALVRADLLHATSEVEYRDIRVRGLHAPVAVIANGIDMPVLPESLVKDVPRTLLYLGRLHPIKGIDQLLHAWRDVEDVHRDWRLVIAGRGEAGHVAELHELAKSLRVERVEFPGPLYGAVKTRAYLGAELFVLPTHSENFGMVVAEALAHGCPALVSRGAPWSRLETEGCGWWVDHDASTLASSLDAAMRLQPEHLAAMGAKGRAWMERDFSWASLAAQMEGAYRWLIDKGDKPDWVRLD